MCVCMCGCSSFYTSCMLLFGIIDVSCLFLLVKCFPKFPYLNILPGLINVILQQISLPLISCYYTKNNTQIVLIRIRLFMYVVYINLLYFLSIFLFTYNKNLLSPPPPPQKKKIACDD